MPETRGGWGTKIGFILAASGSAIGLGNIVFFSSNAYKFGGGAFYIPYLIALFLMGIPVMILELGLGRVTQRSLPNALFSLTGRRGELAGWFCVFNAAIIFMYYITILGWVVGMWVGSFGELWNTGVVEKFTTGPLSNSMTYFFNMISEANPIFYVILVWLFNALIVMKGAKSIEAVVKIFVPLMWLMMIVLIIRGLTLPNGIQGVFYLFTPDFSVMSDPSVWRGAFSQMFFTLSLGMGVMVAYASYLPKKSDDMQNATTISLMNCSFEFIAGLAIFSLLFTFAIAPRGGSISMIFFVVPEGITRFPVMVKFFGFLFFTLLLVAGLTSSVSGVEGTILSLIDKFGLSRRRSIILVFIIGLAGSILFALPRVIDPNLEFDGTLGFTLIDFFDHWAFSYGLLIVGLLELILLGWLCDIDKLITFINEAARIKLGTRFKVLVRYILPLVILLILIMGVVDEVKDGMFGWNYETGNFRGLYLYAFFGWLIFTIGGGILFTFLRRHQETEKASTGSQEEKT
jgi:NSS family neurotransmitter:Na+ symporter